MNEFYEALLIIFAIPFRVAYDVPNRRVRSSFDRQQAESISTSIA